MNAGVFSYVFLYFLTYWPVIKKIYKCHKSLLVFLSKKLKTSLFLFIFFSFVIFVFVAHRSFWSRNNKDVNRRSKS